jgi:DNA-binding response OmpR family regulator
MNILVLDNDEMGRGIMRFLLEEQGFLVSETSDSDSALSLLERKAYQAVILDVILAGQRSGLDFCRRLREIGYEMPVIIVTAKAALADRVAGLRAGADDYIAKPFHPAELVERIKAVFRRFSHQLRNEPTIAAGHLRLDGHELKAATSLGKEVALTPTEMRLLRHLLLNNGRTVSRESLLNSIWGYDYEGESNPLDVYIRRLRKKIEREPSRPAIIQTVRGAGYRLVS